MPVLRLAIRLPAKDGAAFANSVADNDSGFVPDEARQVLEHLDKAQAGAGSKGLGR